MKPIFKKHNAELVNHVFQTLLVAYLVLLLAEQIWTGSVLAYLNLNYFLIIVIIVGVLDVFAEHEIKKQKVRKKDYFFVIVLGVLGFIIIKYKTAELGWISWMISTIAGILIILLSTLVLEEDEEKHKVTKDEIVDISKPYITFKIRDSDGELSNLILAVVGVLGGLGGFLIFWLTQDLGFISYIVCGAGTAFIILMTWYILNKKKI